MAHPAFWFATFPADEDNVSSVLDGKARLSEPEEEAVYLIEMEVPGVQVHHVTIEESNGEIEIMALRLDQEGQVSKTYQDVMFLHPTKADLAQLSASLKDGVLTIRVPKKLPEAIAVKIVNASPPPPLASHTKSDDSKMDDEGDSSNTEFRVTTDIPGVGAENLAVEIRDDTLLVTANRHGQEMYYRWELPPSVDASQAHAYVQHGVFTFVAPRGTGAPSSGVGTRTFYPTESLPAADEEVKITASVASMNIATDGEENDIVVETVQEWENVHHGEGEDSDKKPAAK